MVSSADVVLVMAEEHREAVAELLLKAPIKTFTLKELVRLLEALPLAPDGEPEQVLRERVTEAHRLRRSGFEGNPFDQDIADPLGMPLNSFRAVAWELDEWCPRLVDGLYGPAREA
jgi:protein-tyrosine-phosphatase